MYQVTCAYGDWTDWYDVDDPTGDGDFETLASIVQKHPKIKCPSPTHIQGRQTETKVDAKNSGQEISLDPAEGLICENIGQTCQNYEVRFCCPKSKFVNLLSLFIVDLKSLDSAICTFHEKTFVMNTAVNIGVARGGRGPRGPSPPIEMPPIKNYDFG